MFWRIQALLAKIETVYGTDSAPTGAANAILASDVKVMPMEGQEAKRDYERPFMGAKPTIPAALYSKISFKVEVKGSGTRGVAPAISVLLRACAMAETIVATTSVTYNPITANPESCSIYFNSDGVNYRFLGARGTFTLQVGANGIVYLEFEFTGLFTQPAAMAMPVVAHGTQLTQMPQVAEPGNTPVFTIGGRNLDPSKFALAAGNEVKPRMNVRSQSIIIADKAASIDVTLEGVPLATYNPYVIAAAAGVEPIVLTHGTGNGRICTLSVPSAQIQRPGGLEQTDGIVDWALKFLPIPVAGNDEFTLAFT